MKNVMPMQPYLVLDTDDYEVKKEMKSGISHFYEFSKKKNSKVEMKAVPDGSVDLLFGIGEQDVKTYIGGTVLAAKGWEFEDGRSYFGVRFQPGSCILPEELSIRDLVNKDLEIDGNLFGDHLTEKLAGSKNISERVNVFTTEYAKLRGKELADGIQKLENYLRERIYDTMDAFVSGSWQRKPDIRNVISGVFFSRCMEFRQRILNGLSGFRSCCMS